MKNRSLTVTIEREDHLFVALCPEFDIASQGTTEDETRANLPGALKLFFEHSPPEERGRPYRPAIE